MIPREVKDLILGKYGRTPGPIDPEVKRLAIGDAPQIDHRPADDIPPQMKKLRESWLKRASLTHRLKTF